MAALDAVRAAAERRGVRLCVAVEAPEGAETAPELPEDRAAAIRQRGELEARAVVCLALGDAGSLRRFGRLLHELCISHYRDEAQRARLKLSELGPTRGPQACCRWCIKIATMAECCQDWGAALNFYRAAYQNLAKAVPQVGLKAARSTPLQTGFELAAVAELLDILLNPFKRENEVEHSGMRRSLIIRIDIAEMGKTEHADPVVRADHDHIAARAQIAACLPGAGG